MEQTQNVNFFILFGYDDCGFNASSGKCLYLMACLCVRQADQWQKKVNLYYRFL